MGTIHVKLSEDLRQFIEKEVAAGGFASAEVYLQKLIERDRLHKAQHQLQELLLAGVRSPGIEMTPEEWKSMWREANDLAKRRAASRTES